MGSDICNNLSIVAAIDFLNNLIRILCIVTPILLILFLTIDFVRAVISDDSQKMEKVKSVAIKRIVYAIVVFLVPSIVNGFMGLLGDRTNFSACYQYATSENIQSLADEAEAQRKAEEAENREHRKLLEEEAKKFADLRAKAIKEQETLEESTETKKVDGSTKNIYKNNNISGSSAIAITAEALAYPYNTPKSKWKHKYSKGRCFSSWKGLTGAKPTKTFMSAMDSAFPNHFSYCKNGYNIGSNCHTSVNVVLKYSGYDKSVSIRSLNAGHFKKNKWKEIKNVKNAQRGDICFTHKGNSPHRLIYLGKNRVAESGLGSKRFFQIIKGNCNNAYAVYRATK